MAIRGWMKRLFRKNKPVEKRPPGSYLQVEFPQTGEFIKINMKLFEETGTLQAVHKMRSMREMIAELPEAKENLN